MGTFQRILLNMPPGYVKSIQGIRVHRGIKQNDCRFTDTSELWAIDSGDWQSLNSAVDTLTQLVLYKPDA